MKKGVYKYTHKETGKWYIGSHNGKKKNYTGSGLIWQRAKEKYGIKSFNLEMLYEGPNYREEEERILKELDAANDNMSYNMKNEALGGTFYGKDNGMYGKKHTKESKYKCGSAFRGKNRPDHSIKMKGSGNSMYGKTHTKEVKEKLRKAQLGKKLSDETKEKIRIGNLGTKKTGTSKANKGGGNPSAKKIIFRDIEYTCIKEAMIKTGLSRYKIKKECVYKD